MNIHTDGAHFTIEGEEIVTWAFVVYCNNNKDIYHEQAGHVLTETGKGSRQVGGELTAVLRGIKFARKKGVRNITLHVDYDGCIYWTTKEWKTKKPLTKQYAEHYRKVTKGINVKFVHVASHTGVPGNERADELCKMVSTFGKHKICYSKTFYKGER